MLPETDATTKKPTSTSITAAVIDDAFDDIQPGEITIDQTKVVLQHIEADPGLTSLFIGLGIEQPDLDEVDDEDDEFVNFLRQLWGHADETNPLSLLLANLLFKKKVDKKRQLEQICDNIESNGISVTKYGEATFEDALHTFDQHKYQLVFIDYYLSVQDTNEGKTRAIDVARSIDKALTDSKPVTVLMSSHPDAEAQKSEFRKKALLREAAFEFISKGVLFDVNIASLVIKSITESLNYTNDVHQYILALSEAANSAIDKFQEEIRSLSIDDYAFIQHAKLNKEKHPLGDYMNWLYESRWGSLLFAYEPFKREQMKLDTIQSIKSLPIRDMPSEHIAKMYASALFDDHVEPLGPNPVIASKSTDYYLHTGDIFSKPKGDVIWMVINPGCDLERNVPDHQSILLIPGKLKPLYQKFEKEEIGTDFFQLGETPFKVSWLVKSVLSIPYQDFYKWTTNESVERNHRLKLPFALQIQQEFTTTITRVGTPVSPPIIQQVRVEFWGKDLSTKQYKKLEHPDTLGVKSTMKLGSDESVRFAFNLNFAVILRNVAVSYLDELNNQSTATAPPKNINDAIDKLSQFVGGFAKWFAEKNPFTENFSDKAISIVTDWDGLPNATISTLLVINIKTQSKANDIAITEPSVTFPKEIHSASPPKKGLLSHFLAMVLWLMKKVSRK